MEKLKGENNSDANSCKNDTSENSPSLPLMTPESWELIEYRLWHKFSAKLWAIIGSFLAIVSIAGLLGIPAYIEKSVEGQVGTEKKNLEKLRSTLEATYVKQIIRANLLDYVFEKYRKDSRAFQNAIEKAKPEVAQIDDELYKSTFLDLIKNISSRYLGSDDFKKAIDGVIAVITSKDTQNHGTDNSTVTKLSRRDKWEKIDVVLAKYKAASLSEALNIYPHLMAMRSMISTNEALILKPLLVNDKLKTELYSEYEKELYPAYNDELKKYEPPYSMAASISGEFGWSSMWDKATFAFLPYESEIIKNEKKK